MVSAARSQTKAACPSEARMLEACGTADIKVASIRDSPRTGKGQAKDKQSDSGSLKIVVLPNQRLGKVHK
jgi:hypothetical protein